MKKVVSLSAIILLALGVSTIQAQEPLIKIIDCFDTNAKSEKMIPNGWHSSRKDVSMFSLQAEDGGVFTRVATHGGCTSIGKQCSFSLENYPYLQWRWRVHTLPDKGNENKKKTNDSGAGVYVIFKGKFKLNHIIKYVWSTTLPEGTITESPFNSRTKIVVLRSGKANLGKWIKEKVDIGTDYQKAFGQNPPPIEAIGILTDADNTESVAMADYDDLSIAKE